MRNLFLKMPITFLITFVILNNINAQAPGCPNVTVTAPGAVGGQVSVACNECINLTATVLHTGQTNTYTVSSIPYAPPYPFNTGNSIFVNQDDIWSGVINLPFNFCYYGTSYDKIVVGANGVVSFNLTYANQTCPWSFSANNPSSALPLNSIFGPYHDIDPSVGGAIYQAVLGSYPCRTFVVNYNLVPMFSCNSLRATHQIVLYESTNVIEVYIQNKPLCSSWNGGRAIVGIQNINGTIGVTAPGRNTSPTWTASNEAWRFTPSGTPNYTIQWYDGSTPLGTGNTINVCNSSTYTAIATYDNCDFTQVVVTDQMTVQSDAFTATVSPSSADICQGESVTITTTVVGTPPYTYQWAPNNAISSTTAPNVTVNPSVSTVYSLTISDSFSCSEVFTIPITVHPPPDIQVTASVNPICDGETSVLTATGADTYIWNTGDTNQNITVSPDITTTYTITGTDQYGCTSTSGITIQVSSSPVGAFDVPNTDICSGESTTITAMGGTNYIWSTNDNTATITVSPTENTTYYVTITNNEGCSSTAETSIQVHESPEIDFTAIPLEGCTPINVAFTAQVTGSTNNTYLWRFGTNGNLGTSTQISPTKLFQQSGNHDVSLTVTSGYGCSTTLLKPQYIVAHPIPIADFYASPSMAELGNANISFINQSIGASVWNWNFGDGASSNEQNPFHTYTTGGIFTVELVVYNQYGCKDSTNKYVNIIHNLSFYVPQAFSPNGDGINDFFGPVGTGIEEIDFKIYDRWGKQVFYTNDMDKHWDGRINGQLPNQSAVYSWIAYVKFVTGIVKDYNGYVVMYW